MMMTCIYVQIGASYALLGSGGSLDFINICKVMEFKRNWSFAWKINSIRCRRNRSWVSSQPLSGKWMDIKQLEGSALQVSGGYYSNTPDEDLFATEGSAILRSTDTSDRVLRHPEH